MSQLPPLSLPPVTMEKTPSSELTPTRLGFPTEFPYEFDSSPFTSPDDSTDESSDDEEDFLAGLSRRLAPSTHHRLPPPSFTSNSESTRKLAATSPQSTLNGLGSYSNSGSRSPVLLPPSHPHTTSSHRDSVLDVISAAAGEVARLKLGSYEPRQNAAFHTDERYCIQQQRLLLHQMWLSSQKRVLNEENLRRVKLNALTNAVLARQQHAGTPLKRPSAGTGVFLPRRYPASPSEPIKKPVPVNASKVNFDEFVNVKSRSSQFDYECMVARSRLLARQGNYRAVGCLNEERRLPQDWMY